MAHKIEVEHKNLAWGTGFTALPLERVGASTVEVFGKSS